MSKRLAVLLVLVALLPACGLFRKSAASVNGAVIPVADLDQELAWMQAVPEYQQALLSAERAGAEGTAKVQQEITALHLNRLIVFEIVNQEIDRRGLRPTEDERRQAITDTVLQISDVLGDTQRAVDVFNSLPDGFRIALVDRQARAALLQQSLATTAPSEAQLEGFYEANRDLFERVCARYILSNTQQQSLEALTRVRQGQDFAQVARDVSADPNAPQTGGDVGCFDKASVEEVFAEAAFSTAVGQVVGPVQSEVGWYVIQVYERTGESFAEARSAVEQRYAQSGPAIAFQSLIQALLADADVRVNPKYGQWDSAQRKVVVPE